MTATEPTRPTHGVFPRDEGEHRIAYAHDACAHDSLQRRWLLNLLDDAVTFGGPDHSAVFATLINMDRRAAIVRRAFAGLESGGGK